MDYEALQTTFSYVNDILLGVYTIEFLMKVIALGLVNGKHAYLSSAWNMLDFLRFVSKSYFLAGRALPRVRVALIEHFLTVLRELH